MTQTTVRAIPQPNAAAQIGAQVGRAIRIAKPVTTVRSPLPRIPFRREDLFKEAAYKDGQPYARDEEDDDSGDR